MRPAHCTTRTRRVPSTSNQQQRHAGGNTPPELVRRRGKMTTERKSFLTEVRAALDRYGVEDAGHRHLHKAVDMQRTVRGGRLLLIALLPRRLSRDSYGTGEVVMASRPVRFISGAGQSVVCPYDHSHIVQSNRLLRHILKCRKNYTGPDLAVCRYSAVHIMRPAEIALHEASCPYGRKVGERSKSAVIHRVRREVRSSGQFQGATYIEITKSCRRGKRQLRERAAEHAANVRKKEEQMATQSPTLLQEHGGPVSSEASCRDFLKQVSALPKAASTTAAVPRVRLHAVRPGKCHGGSGTIVLTERPEPTGGPEEEVGQKACATCNRPDHMRKSSKKCPYYKKK
ncbi:factor 1 [Branchiostoma belcheri]|nr:factor 1 [Branchiostoma belcheri]